MKDVFQPHTDPARMLYDAFQDEAKKRNGRTPEQWMDAERTVVWAAARDYAQQHGLRVPLMSDVMRAEEYARGSVDYGAKWAYRVAEQMRKED